MSTYNPAKTLSAFVAPKFTDARNLIERGGNVHTSRDNLFTGNNTFSGSKNIFDYDVGIGVNNPSVKLEVNGAIKANYNSDTTSYLGRVAIGHNGNNDYASFGHLDNLNVSNNALSHSPNGKTFLNSASGQNVSFNVSNAEKMVLDSNGNLGINTSNPQSKLDLNGGLRVDYDNDNNTHYIGRTAINNITHLADTMTISHVDYHNLIEYALKQSETGKTYLNSGGTNTELHLACNNNDIMKLEDGNITYYKKSRMNNHLELVSGANSSLFIGQNSDGIFGQGTGGQFRIFADFSSPNGNLHFYNPTGANSYLRTANVNNALNFTGQHKTFIDNIPFNDVNDTNIGLIVSANKNDYIKMSNGIARGNEAITIEESLPVVSLSRIANDKTVFGVISYPEDYENRDESYGAWTTNYKKEIGDTRVKINSLGEGAIWVSNINGNLDSGDYIASSSIMGYGMKQDDDILHNYTVAKITMDCDFNPQKKYIQKIKKNLDLSGNETTDNDLDTNGLIQWIDTTTKENAYKIRYVDALGKIMSKQTYTKKLKNNEIVYICAFVGCTYHCG